jgi:23S rRNA pseudouridine1911/1915/1917 synthase
MRVEAGPGNAGERLDSFLAAACGLTRSAVQKLIGDGRVRLGGNAVKKNYRVSAGDILEVELPEPAETGLRPSDIPLDIVYEDDDIIVINKPRGMVVHPAAGHTDDTLVNALLAHCGESLSGINGELRLGIVHRLDKDTSGLIVAAKNDRAHLSLAKQIKARTVKRVYEAVVRGGFREARGRVEAPIGRNPANRKKMAVTDKGSRRAVTDWEVIETFYGTPSMPAYTHVRCILQTGRTHQIRVHMAHIGHPVIGDPLYGGTKDEFGLGGQCLHARRLEFDHPATGELISFVSDLPDYFKRVLTILANRV